jgi:hypothetical protein
MVHVVYARIRLELEVVLLGLVCLLGDVSRYRGRGCCPLD